MKINNKIIKLQIWDISGEKDRTVSRLFYRKANCVFITYDITKENSFAKIATVEADKTEFIDKSPPEKQTVSYQVFAICSDKTRSAEGKAFDIKTK